MAKFAGAWSFRTRPSSSRKARSSTQCKPFSSPQFKFNEAVSLQVFCETQEEVDYYWERLGEGGDEQAQTCGWLKDKFGLSWQVIPTAMLQMLEGPASENTRRATQAMFQMKKLDLEALQRAYAG